MPDTKRGCYYCANRRKFSCVVHKKNWRSLFNGLIKTETDILKYDLGIKCWQFKAKKVEVILI